MAGKSFAEIIRKFTGSDFSEPSEEVITHFKRSLGRLFDNVGYIREGISQFGTILEFMARYELATLDHKLCETVTSEPFMELYEREIKGKRFRFPKGMFLCGKYGTGKTLAARIIAECFGLPFIDTYSISFQYQKKDGNDWIEKWLYSHSHKTVIIDDLGAEGDIKKFGNESPIGAIIATRARFWEMYGTPTIYTTNKENPKMLAGHYSNDHRLLDRIESYHVPVLFTGASLRR